MQWAWVDPANTIRDLCPQGYEPADVYTPEIAAYYNTQVPDYVVNGATFNGTDWVNPVPPEPGPPPPVVISADMARNCLTLPDKVKWDNNETPQIVTVKNDFAGGLTNPSATENMQFLYDTQSIGLASLDKFKATYPVGG